MVKILIIEDDKDIQDIYKQYLSLKIPNCSIYIASTIRQAEQWLAFEQFKIAIVDYILPDGHGLYISQSMVDLGIKTYNISGSINSQPDNLSQPLRFYNKIDFTTMVDDIALEVA